MRSGTSFFDTTIYKNALRRFWPLGAACAAVWVFHLSQMRGRMGYVGTAAAEELARDTLNSPIPAFAAIAAAMAVYGWLHRLRSAAFVTALPVRREAVFLSDMAAGATLLLGGAAAAAVIAPLLTIGSGIGMSLGLWLAATWLLCLAYFGVATLCAALTGHVLGLPVFYAIALYAAVALESSLRRIVQFLVFGVTGQKWILSKLSPVYYLRTFSYNLVETTYTYDGFGGMALVNIRFLAWPYVLGFTAVGAVCALLAVLLLRRRQMESAGDVVAVPFLKKLFPWGAAVAVSLSAGLMTLENVFGYGGYTSSGAGFHRTMVLLAILLLGGFVGWFGAQMLLRKTLRVFDRSWVGWGVFSAVVLVLVLGLELDAMGWERRLPDRQKVDHAAVWCYNNGAYPTDFRESENIDAVMALQKKIVANKSAFEYDGPSAFEGGTLEIVYYDAQGRELMRRGYTAPTGAMAWTSSGNAYAWASGGNASGEIWASANPALKDLETLMNTREAVRSRIEPADVELTAATARNAFLYVQHGWDMQMLLELGSRETWEFYQNALLPDSRDTSLGYLELMPQPDGIKPEGRITIGVNFCSERPGDDSFWWGFTVNNTADSRRTNAWLEAHGIHLYPDGTLSRWDGAEDGGADGL